MSVAQTILEQLGGGRFVAMTGAKNFVGGERHLRFKLPANFARDGINLIEINLTAADLYDVSYYQTRGLNVRKIAADDGLYYDQLRVSFKARTGLDVSL